MCGGAARIDHRLQDAISHSCVDHIQRRLTIDRANNRGGGLGRRIIPVNCSELVITSAPCDFAKQVANLVVWQGKRDLAKLFDAVGGQLKRSFLARPEQDLPADSRPVRRVEAVRIEFRYPGRRSGNRMMTTARTL